MSEPQAAAADAQEEFDPHAPIKWSDYGIDDYFALFVFWLLAIDIFVQFFMRYALNASPAWTEEFARYLLIVVTFFGGAIAVRKNSHIMVEFFYKYLGPQTAFGLSTLVDLTRVGFFFVLAWLCYKTANKTLQMMVTVDIPKRYLFYLVAAGSFWMGVRAIFLAWRNWRQGGSVLTTFFRNQ